MNLDVSIICISGMWVGRFCALACNFGGGGEHGGHACAIPGLNLGTPKREHALRPRSVELSLQPLNIFLLVCVISFSTRHSLLLVLHLGVTPGRLWGLFGAWIEPRLNTYKEYVLHKLLSLCF